MSIEQLANEVAWNVDSYVQTACGEMGYQIADEGEAWEDDLNRELQRLKSRGVRDLGGALADFMYNDAGTVEDLAGDNLYEVMGRKGLDVNNKEHWDACVTAFKKCVPHVASKLNLGFVG
jgi:hypothetical protein